MSFTSQPHSLSEERYVDEATLITMAAAKKRITFTIVVGSAVIAMGALMAAIARSLLEGTVAGALIGFGICTVMVYASATSGQRAALRQITLDPANAAMFHSKVVTLDDEGVRTRSVDGSEGFCSWRSFVGWRESGDACLLHLSRILFLWIPLAALDAEMLAFMRSKLANCPPIDSIPRVAPTRGPA